MWGRFSRGNSFRGLLYVCSADLQSFSFLLLSNPWIRGDHQWVRKLSAYVGFYRPVFRVRVETRRGQPVGFHKPGDELKEKRNKKWERK